MPTFLLEAFSLRFSLRRGLFNLQLLFAVDRCLDLIASLLQAFDLGLDLMDVLGGLSRGDCPNLFRTGHRNEAAHRWLEPGLAKTIS